MIERTDVLLLLTELQNTGVDVSQDIKRLYSSDDIPLDILKRINNNKPIDLLLFYEKLRKSYNKKQSKLYINIMRSDENLIKDPKQTLTTLSSLLNQILLFKPDDPDMFYKHARANEIIKVLAIYLQNSNIEPAYKLLTLFKADIKVLSEIKK